MSPQQGIMSLAQPRANSRDSRAVDQILSNTTQMLGKLDNKTLGLLLQLTQYLKAHKSKYKELMAKLEAKGSLPPGVFPDHYDPKFLSVFALSVAKAQQAKGGMAAGGIASIAQTMKDQGRGKDTMLAHISPEEAELLEKRGGVGTTNPVTGLPEYGIFEDIGNALSGVGNAVGSVLKPVGDLIGGVLSSPLGLAATAAAAYYFLGPGAAVVPSVAEAALPGAAVAEIGTAAHLTPAAIEAGIGSAGYGTNASAAASGLFDPSVIGSGAAIGAPSTSEKLLTANLLKNTRLSADDKEAQSDPNALIKMLMMYEMMGSKQNQPTNIPLPELTEATSSLPYDTPKKKMSSFISTQPTQNAAGGGLMTKHLGIGGLSAKRSQTDYAKNYLPGSGYRPGQGGITYFTPMEYTGGDETTSTDTTDTSSSSATDELLRQTIGRTGGGGQSQEQRDQREADLDRMDDYLGMTMRDYWNLSESERADVDAAAAERNPIRGGILKAVKALGYPMILRVIDGLKSAKDTVQQTWADNTLRSLGIDPKIVLANQNEIAGMSMQQALTSLGQNTTPTYATPFGDYYDAPLSSRTDISGDPLQKAMLKRDYPDDVRAALIAQDEDRANEARIDKIIASLPDSQGVYPSDMGAIPTIGGDRLDANMFGGEKGIVFKNRTALNPFPGYVTEKIARDTKNVGDYTPGQFQGAYLPASQTEDTSSVFAQMEAEDAALRAEQAALGAAEEKAYAERMAAKPVDAVDAVDTTYMREAFDKIKENRDSLEKEIALGVDKNGDPLTQSYMDGLKSFLADNNKSLAKANAKGLLSPEASRDAFKRELQQMANLANADPSVTEGNSGLVFNDRAATINDKINKIDSQYGDRFAPTSAMGMYTAQETADAINNLKPGSLLYAPVDYSNQYLSPEAYQAEVDKLNAVDSNAEEAKPITEGEKLDQFVQALLSMEPTQLGEPIQLAALGDYNLGEGETSGDTIGNYSMFTPKEATETPGLLSTAAIQQAFPGAFSESPFGSLAPTSYSYLGGQGGNSILGGYGGEGSAWQGVTDRYGNPVLTMQGAAERAFLSSPEGIALGNERALEGYTSPFADPAQRQGQGNAPQGGEPQGPSDGGDTGRYSGDNSGDNAGWGSRDAGGDARGGYLQHGKFDQRMAHGGIANLQYNLGSYSDGGRLLKGPGDGVSDDIPATIGQGQPARLADGEFVIPARIVSELGNGSTDAGAKRLYEMMDRIQKVRRKTKNVAANTKAAKYLPA
jgi:hypothetical protein